MKRTHHATLKDRPEALDGVGMHCADHILSLGVIDDLVRVLLIQLAVSHPLICNQQADVIGYGFIDKAGQGFGFHVSNKYLPLYVAEFEFRYNNRMNKDIFGAAIAGC